MRTYDSQSMIDLPTLDSLSASTLAKKLIAVASPAEPPTEAQVAAKKPAGRKGAAKAAAASPTAPALPDALAKRLEKLKTAEAALTATLGDQLTPEQATERADIAAKAVWWALENWLTGWTRLPATEPLVAVAVELKKAVVRDDLQFTRQKSQDMWAEANRRLVLVEQSHLDASFQALGGTPFLHSLQTTQAELGLALGITGVPPERPAPPALKPQYNAIKKAIREYVVQVVAHVDDDDPATSQLRDALLKPLVEWISKPATKTTPEDSSGKTPPKKTADGSSGDAPPQAGEKPAAGAGTEQVQDVAPPPPAGTPEGAPPPAAAAPPKAGPAPKKGAPEQTPS